jgi:hypothetical protein
MPAPGKRANRARGVAAGAMTGYFTVKTAKGKETAGRWG